VRAKHTRLFCRRISDEEKVFKALTSSRLIALAKVEINVFTFGRTLLFSLESISRVVALREDPNLVH